jgi:hypothetical protein
LVLECQPAYYHSELAISIKQDGEDTGSLSYGGILYAQSRLHTVHPNNLVRLKNSTIKTPYL